MITIVSRTMTGRTSWRTGKPTETTIEYAQIEGTITAVREERSWPVGHLVYTIDAGNETVEVRDHGTRPDCEYTVGQVGERVRVLADQTPNGYSVAEVLR